MFCQIDSKWRWYLNTSGFRELIWGDWIKYVSTHGLLFYLVCMYKTYVQLRDPFDRSIDFSDHIISFIGFTIEANVLTPVIYSI